MAFKTFVPTKSDPTSDEVKGLLYAQHLLLTKLGTNDDPAVLYRQFVSLAQKAPFCVLDGSGTTKKEVAGDFNDTARQVMENVLQNDVTFLSETATKQLRCSESESEGSAGNVAMKQPDVSSTHKSPTAQNVSASVKHSRKRIGKQVKYPHCSQKEQKPANLEARSEYAGDLMDAQGSDSMSFKDEVSDHHAADSKPPITGVVFQDSTTNDDCKTINALVLLTPAWSYPKFYAYYVSFESKKEKYRFFNPFRKDTFRITGECHVSQYSVNIPMVVELMKKKADVVESAVLSFLSEAFKLE